MTLYLPYGRPLIDNDDIDAVTAALRDDMLTTGPRVAEFEQAFAAASGATEAVACNSGTAALHLAVLTARLGPGQCAIVPAVTFVATANVVRMTGADVIFADVDAETGLLTPDTLVDALARARRRALNVTAALPVHLNGQCCEMAELAAIAEREGIVLIEDACHALGVPGIGANRYSVAACFSTHPVKPITTAEGGVVTPRKLNACDLYAHMGSREIRMHSLNWNWDLTAICRTLGIMRCRKLAGITGFRMCSARLALVSFESSIAFSGGDRRLLLSMTDCWHRLRPWFDRLRMAVARTAGTFMWCLLISRRSKPRGGFSWTLCEPKAWERRFTISQCIANRITVRSGGMRF
jgi:dTDP-4-amino-4,6-dideoxygalactose transaminase